MAQEQVSVVLDLNQYGINQQLTISVPKTIEGVTYNEGDAFVPRNQIEINSVERIAGKVAGTVAKSTGTEQMIIDRVDEINDPLGFKMKQAKQAANAPGAPGFMSAMAEFGDILPGGQPFEPGKIGKGLANFGIRALTGEDPKSRISDVTAIGADVGAAAVVGDLMGADKIPNGMKNLRLANTFNKKLAVIAGAGATGKAVGNEAYELINDAIRYFEGIPNPTEAVKNDQQLRELLDMRNELLFSGGALGLQRVFGYVKPFLGNILGVKSKAAKEAAKKGEELGIPMNVFSVSESGFVQGAGKVIGLFPFVATKARQAQNVQRVAVADTINRTMNNLSPIGLFSEAGMLANKEFRNMVSQFAGTKTVLYNRALSIGDKVGDAFLPTERLRKQAQALQEFYYGPQGMAGAADEAALTVADPRGYGNLKFDEIIKKFTGDADDFRTAIMSLATLNQDHITGRQFRKLQNQLNTLKSVASEKKSLGVDMGGVDDMTNTMIEILNDTDAYKDLQDPAKDALVSEFGAAMQLANDFFFQNVGKTQGRTAQIIAMGDPNALKAGADVAPAFYTPDMLTKILINDETMIAPLAIKEMKESLGADAVKAAVRSHLDESIRGATSYISGTVPIQDLAGKAALEGGQATVKQVPFNIPIVDVNNLKNAFGMNNPNRIATMKEVFGEDQYRMLEDTLNLAQNVEQVDFGFVSDFVKRRGFLGGIGAIRNVIPGLAMGGTVVANPFQGVGTVILARYGMSKMADPKFLKSVQTLMNPDLSAEAKNTAMARLGTMVFDDESDNRDVPASVTENYDPNNPVDVMRLLIFAGQNNVSYPGSEDMVIQVEDDGRVSDIEISKAQSKQVFSDNAQGGVDSVNELNAASVTEPVAPQTSDPFLDVDFASMVDQTGVGMGTSAPTNLNDAQRAALAGGNLDEAIALGNRGMV
jgi:hypothetical protein